MIETTKTIMNPSAPPGIEWYLSAFEVFEKSLNGMASGGLHQIRTAAIARFSELGGFPTTRNEEWKYTDVSSIARKEFQPLLNSTRTVGVSKTDLARYLLGDFSCTRIVFVNGRFHPELSSFGPLPRGAQIRSLGEALKHQPDTVCRHLTKYAAYESGAFTALSTAFLLDGAFVDIPDGTILEAPIHFLYLSTGADVEFMTHPRNLIIMGKNSQASIIESYASLRENTYFTNAVTEILLRENAALEYDKLLLESAQAFHVGTMYVQQERSSSFTSNALIFSGGLVRNNIFAVLDGEGAEATLNGLYLGTGTQHIDNHTTIDHAKPHCPSHELYKGILAGKSRGVFNGKIKVRKDAQKTDAKQTNKNLILSDEASIDTKPQLEIFANDVKCTHGATIGQLDDEQLFYLRSRGIDSGNARDMLIYAFASDVIERIKVTQIRSRLHDMIRHRLQAERKQ